MGVIIALPQRQMAKPDDAVVASQGPCEILFFTGVRYQRHEEERAQVEKPARPASGRPRNGTPRRRRG
ncbi:MAG: hypothetical protein ACRDBH_07965 [Bosea sp. (in: a-proteobacteria)]